jgi:signal transduction histidine kinase
MENHLHPVMLKIITAQVFIYGIAIACGAGILILLNFFQQRIQAAQPEFPFWLIPLFVASGGVLIGVAIWKHMRQSDLLKYEFITVVTHKLRNPLTHIKWAAENLSKENLSPDAKTQIEFIDSANTKLVELTSLLMNVSEAENNGYAYSLTKNNLTECVDDIIFSLKLAADSRRVTLVKNYSTTEPLFANFDLGRLKFVIQTFIENAIHYTAEKSSVIVSISKKETEILFSVKDSGIGISPEELPLLFSKFYRGKQAKLTDTEGMGIGLYISKEVLARHQGRIWAESEGSGKGSTFSFALPTPKE